MRHIAWALCVCSVFDTAGGQDGQQQVAGRSDGPDSRPLAVAHRGVLKHAPENTLENFRACLELRIGFEFDVQRTRDGHLVCIHDSTVDRTTDGTGRVVDLTLADIRRLDAGRWFSNRFVGVKVPTVEEVLRLIAEYRQHNVLVAVDIKAENVAGDVVILARKFRVLHRLVFIGRTISEPAVRQQIKQASPRAATATVANNRGEFAAALNASNTDWVYVRYLASKQEVAAVHRAGKRVFIAGSNVSGSVPDNWRRAATAGIDAILTDYPLELQSALGPRSSDK